MATGRKCKPGYTYSKGKVLNVKRYSQAGDLVYDGKPDWIVDSIQ
jgi:hypothetical protein